MQTPIDRAAAHVGGLTQLAAKLGESLQAVMHWRTRGVPIRKCVAVERACEGAVRRWELRPDDWHLIWPELIGADGAPGVQQAA